MPILKIDTDLGTVSVVNADGTEKPVTLPVDPEEKGEPRGLADETDESLGGDLSSMEEEEANEGPDADASETPEEQAKEDEMGTEEHPEAAAAAQGEKKPLFGGKAKPFGPKKAPKTFGW